MNGGTREAILALRTLANKMLNIKRNTYIEFMDLEAFDAVNCTL